ncbi:MAG: phenylalanyl-tRNA synthetase alpha chain [Chloroflexi bacterium]|nr:MAG: phenylalanyl-tRNA synthetase alpha chain [Chloroflexota bacterium]
MALPDLAAIESDARRDLAAAADAPALDDWRTRYLGRKGILTALLRGLSDLPQADRPAIGQGANQLKRALEAALTERQQERRRAETEAQAPAATSIDVTLPARPHPQGQLHPVTLTRRAMERVFREMGFDVVEGPEVEWDTYNFDRLRVPRDHPARDMWDTIWIDPESPEDPAAPLAQPAPRRLLRTHTSPMQIRYLEAHQPPIRVVVPGTCYRYEATDAAHEWMLTQIEGLVIDENISFPHLKGTLESFVHRFLGPGLETRFRCDYFPFVEPGAELSIRWGDRWLEMLGAGMVHPEIIEAAGLDPERYTGFAFGMGVERFAMLRYGIEDIRNFYQNDLRFLQQFRGVS